jgi:hypothetical protein
LRYQSKNAACASKENELCGTTHEKSMSSSQAQMPKALFSPLLRPLIRFKNLVKRFPRRIRKVFQIKSATKSEKMYDTSAKAEKSENKKRKTSETEARLFVIIK